MKDLDGSVKPGLIQLLKTLFLDYYVEKVRAGEPVKVSIWFFNKVSDIADVYDELCDMLPEHAANPKTCPFVMNHSSVGPITAEGMRKRRGDITMYLSTSVMLLGLDFSDVDIVGMVRPFSLCHYMVQAAGRGGRKLCNGQRRKVVFYLLFNRSDIGDNMPGLSKEVKELCETNECLKVYLKKFFGFSDSGAKDSEWCCSNCWKD